MTTAPNTTSPPITPSPTKPTPWHEIIPGTGIRRDHRTNCPASKTRRPTTRCTCPYSYWLPQEAGRPRRRATVHGTLADAKRAKDQATTDAKERKHLRHNQQAGAIPMPTTDEWFEQLLKTDWSQLRLSTLETRKVEYRRVSSAFGKTRIDRITPATVKAWMYDLIDTEGSRRCVQMSYECLRSMLTLAKAQRLIPFNPVDGVPYPKKTVEKKHLRTLTKDEYRKLLDACRDMRDRTIIRIACEAGLRRGELLALQVGDIDLEGGYIHIQRRTYSRRSGGVEVSLPKSGKPRTVGISESLAYDIAVYLEGERDPKPTRELWVRMKSGEQVPLTGSALMKIFRRVTHAAGLTLEGGRFVTPHDLRRTGASLAVLGGVPELIVMQQLGHSELSTTQRYYLKVPNVEALKAYGEALS